MKNNFEFSRQEGHIVGVEGTWVGGGGFFYVVLPCWLLWASFRLTDQTKELCLSVCAGVCVRGRDS